MFAPYEKPTFRDGGCSPVRFCRMLKHSSAELLRSPDKQCGSMCVFIEIEGGTILFMIYLYRQLRKSVLHTIPFRTKFRKSLIYL